jgi:DNA-binding beta-propeller fold protein YncE
MVRLAAAVCALVVVAIASAAGPPAVSLAGKLPASVTVGKPFSVRLAARGARKPVVVARGSRTKTFVTTRTAAGRYSASVKLTAAGLWTLSARLGGKTYRLGAVTARRATPVAEPLLFSTPAQIVARSDGALVLAEGGKNRVVAFDPVTKAITPIGGAGGAGTSGDGGPALSANIGNPFGVAVAPDGNTYVTADRRLRRIDAGGRITTLFTTSTEIGPVTVDEHSDVYFAIEAYVYRYEAASGAVTTVAGTGTLGGAGDGGPAAAAQVNRPHALFVPADGALLLADTENHSVRRIDPATRVITTVARGFSGPAGLCRGPTGGEIIVTDFTGQTVSRLDASGPVVIAGNGVKASSGDGKPATQASLDTPLACASAGGKLYVVEGGGTGTIRVISGTSISTLSR